MHTQEWPARRCAGPCDQGRRECQTPDACRVPAGEFGPRPNSVARWAAVAFGGVVILLACVSVIALAAWLSRVMVA